MSNKEKETVANLKKRENNYIDIELLMPNPINPRKIKEKDFRDLVESIRDNPAMMKIRPLILDDNMNLIGGNQRLKACKYLGWTEVPYDVFTKEESEEMNRENKTNKTYEEHCKEIMVKDNKSAGFWDDAILAREWKREDLAKWGIPVKEQEDIEGAEVEFSEYLGEENNYVVLMFNNEIDWLNAQTHFNIKSVYSKRQNGKPWSKGVGRVINGAEYLKKLNG